jgi:hypothetical protein
MSEGKVLFDGGIKSQPAASVKSMIEFFDGKACERLPKKIMMADGWWLVLSSKKNEYHLTSRDACSCKGFQYRRTCRHITELREKEGLPVPLVDLYAFDTLSGEIAYWQEKEQNALVQPMVQPIEEDARLRAAHSLRDNIIAAQEA